MVAVLCFAAAWQIEDCAATVVSLPDSVEALAPAQDLDFYDVGNPPDAKVALGRALFFDKILSGNRNIACATCHHPDHASGDGLSLPLGEGAIGLGPKRKAVAADPVFGRVPRNSQALFNLGATEFRAMFHDGRVAEDPYNNWKNGFWSPAREQLPPGLDNVLAVQAMFPVVSRIEMLGHKGENEIANAVAADRLTDAWELLTDRLRAIPEYMEMFRAAYPEVQRPDQVSYVQAANAIAAFESVAFRSTGSPFDRYLATRDPTVLSPQAIRGMSLFYGEAGCSSCHAGRFQTDHGFHAIAMPQIGPGKADGKDQSYWKATGFARRLEDYGRYRVTFRREDLYKFRTPSLRNVELTGPWGHAGAYASLEAVIRHHLNPVDALGRYSIDQAVLPAVEQVIEETGEGAGLHYDAVNPARISDYRKRDGWVQANPPLRQAIAEANELVPRNLTDTEISDLIEFLNALTDPNSRDLRHLVPASVPSGLPVGD